MIYLAKWGVSQTPLMETFDRTVEHLYMYSPTSFGWREVLLSGTPIDEPVVGYGPFVMNTEGEIRQAVEDYRNGRMGHLD